MIKQVHLIHDSLFSMFPLVVLSIFSTSGCTLISSYDQQKEAGLTEIQWNMDVIQVKLQDANKPAECAYNDDYKSLYEKAKVQVLVLQVRAEVIPKSDLEVTLLNNLLENINTLQNTHRTTIGCMSQEELGIRQNELHSNIRMLLKIELGKKRASI